jgi:WG containing repeat
MVIEPQYQIANKFSEGLAVVVKDEIKTESHVDDQPSQSIVVVSRVVQRKQIIVAGSHENLPTSEATESEMKTLLLINKSGQTVLTRTTAQVQFNINEEAKFSEGLIEAYDCVTRKIGFMDKTGNFVIQPKYRHAAPFSERLARVSVLEDNEEKLGFIDHEGRFVIPPRFNTDADFARNSTDFSETLASLSEGLRPHVTQTENSVYINTKGEIVLFTDFSYSGPFHDGVAVAYDPKSNKWGYIDKSGTAIISPRFDRARDFSDGLAAVSIIDSSKAPSAR